MNIVLVEGRNLMSKDNNEVSDAYVKFRLGNEKYKSKVIYLKCFYTNLNDFSNSNRISLNH